MSLAPDPTLDHQHRHSTSPSLSDFLSDRLPLVGVLLLSLAPEVAASLALVTTVLGCASWASCLQAPLSVLITLALLVWALPLLLVGALLYLILGRRTLTSADVSTFMRGVGHLVGLAIVHTTLWLLVRLAAWWVRSLL